MAQFEINKTYTFNTRAPNVLGSLIENMLYQGSVGYDIANAFLNVQQTQRAVLPELPEGTPKDITKYVFHLFSNPSTQNDARKRVVFADAWIDESTVRERSTIDLTIMLPNVTNADVEKVRSLLFLNGYRGMVLTQN